MQIRRKNWRRVLERPTIKGFTPFGEQLKERKDPVFLLFEEYEALKLCDYDNLNHQQASEIMNVSRPTFTRIYATVRQKLAKAFVEGRTISIEGGKIYFDSNWYHCHSCKCNFNNQNHDNHIMECALCGSKSIETIIDCSKENNSQSNLNEIICIKCGHKMERSRGRLRSQNICSDCIIPQ